MNNTQEVTMTWFWMNIPLAVLFFLAWTLIPLWMVLKHPDTGPDIPAKEEDPPGHAPAAVAGSALASGPSTPAASAYARLPGSPREEALAGQR
jgi:hypothetical protein